MPADIKAFLDKYEEKYNTPAFIESDPMSIPKRFTKLQDIEISAFWTAMLAWGRRKNIINKANVLMELMDDQPYDFVLHHSEKDKKRFLEFKHRTFQPTDALYFLEFFSDYYRRNESLEDAFSRFMTPGDENVENALRGFRELFFSLPYVPGRTKKHVSTPASGSACKRLNMFLRWMVRNDDKGVDFGLWKKIRPDQLLIPLDVHVDRVAKNLGLLKRKQTDWKAVLELSETLKTFDPKDPAKYDFALFGLGLFEPPETWVWI